MLVKTLKTHGTLNCSEQVCVLLAWPPGPRDWHLRQGPRFLTKATQQLHMLPSDLPGGTLPEAPAAHPPPPLALPPLPAPPGAGMA